MGKTGQNWEEFSSTRWTLVAQAAALDPEQRAAAVDALLRRYIPALRAHLVMRKRLDPDRADDILQDFVLRKVVQREVFAAADRSRGKFRTFLLTILDRFVIDTARQERARGQLQSLDACTPLAASELQEPGAAFDLVWAQQTLGLTIGRMRSACLRDGQENVWAVFEARLLSPAVTGTPPLPYEQLATQFRFASAKQAANAIVTAKRKFDDVLRRTVAEYVAEDEDIKAEIIELQRILLRPHAFDARELAHWLASCPEDQHGADSALVDADPSHLASLLSEQSSANSVWQGGDLAALWAECLSLDVRRLLSDLGGALAHVDLSGGFSGLVTVGEVLHHVHPPLAVLRDLQRLAKRCRRGDVGRLPGRVAELLYFACIAAALCRHGERITRLGDGELAAGWALQLGCHWLDPATRGLLVAASERLGGPAAADDPQPR
jgi:RNA polymerase sigma-70 factor (ECF subfamily)